MLQADLHIHTKYSFDSSINPRSLVDRLNAHPFIKVAAITDHNTLEGYIKVKQLASSYKDILIIPGIEVATAIGDLMVLGVEENPPTSRDVKETIDFAKKHGGVIIVPHPYRECGLGDLARRYPVDAIETLNGRTSSRVNKLAESLAAELNLPGIAGSDAHNLDELWTVANEIQATFDVDEVLGAIKKKGLVKPFSIEKSIHF